MSDRIALITPDPEADAARRRGLRRMRTVAVSLLLLAALVYLLTLDRDGFWGFVNAGAEVCFAATGIDPLRGLSTPVLRPGAAGNADAAAAYLTRLRAVSPLDREVAAAAK